MLWRLIVDLRRVVLGNVRELADLITDLVELERNGVHAAIVGTLNKILEKLRVNQTLQHVAGNERETAHWKVSASGQLRTYLLCGSAAALSICLSVLLKAPSYGVVFFGLHIGELIFKAAEKILYCVKKCFVFSRQSCDKILLSLENLNFADDLCDKDVVIHEG